MDQKELAGFPSEVSAQLKVYVYRLIDPRNGETFYVGKGVGGRVFAHVHGASGIEGDQVSNKMRRIWEIQLAGFEVGHVIHRHGMDDATAFEVESAVMDAYPGLTNIMGGVDGAERGAMHARQIMRLYAAETAVIEHDALLINVNRSAAEVSVYDAVRSAWKIGRKNAERAEVVLATVQGLIVGAFVAERWLEATEANFPGRAAPGRLGFEGREASEEVKRLYVGKRVPEAYRKRGAANPVRYAWEGAGE